MDGFQLARDGWHAPNWPIPPRHTRQKSRPCLHALIRFGRSRRFPQGQAAAGAAAGAIHTTDGRQGRLDSPSAWPRQNGRNFRWPQFPLAPIPQFRPPSPQPSTPRSGTPATPKPATSRRSVALSWPGGRGHPSGGPRRPQFGPCGDTSRTPRAAKITRGLACKARGLPAAAGAAALGPLTELRRL